MHSRLRHDRAGRGYAAAKEILFSTAEGGGRRGPYPPKTDGLPFVMRGPHGEHCGKTLPHVEAMEAGEILNRVDDVETLDKIGRRTFKLDDKPQIGVTFKLLQVGGSLTLVSETGESAP